MGESNPRSPRWAAIALVPAATFALLGAVDLAFRALADTEHWIAAGARLTDLSDHADEAFAYLIEQDAVTWDPSNGTRMDEVLAHLRPGEGERVLLLGSSQLLTLRDDRRLAAYAKRADKVLERIAPHSASVYNLSVGAMTAPEKALVLDRALGLEPFDHVLVCLNPWDSRQATVRPALAAIPERVERAGPASWLDGIPRIAPAMQRVLRDTLDAHIGFFARREAIRAWIHSLGRAQDTAEVRLLDRGRPVEYRWDATEQRDVEQNALELVAHLAGRAREHGFRGWIVLMPRRPDDEHPLYEPGFERRFSTIVAAASAHEGLGFIDASSLLDATHFGLYEFGELRGRIDAIHFDARGHERLARCLADSLWSQRSPAMIEGQLATPALRYCVNDAVAPAARRTARGRETP